MAPPSEEKFCHDRKTVSGCRWRAGSRSTPMCIPPSIVEKMVSNFCQTALLRLTPELQCKNRLTPSAVPCLVNGLGLCQITDSKWLGLFQRTHGPTDSGLVAIETSPESLHCVVFYCPSTAGTRGCTLQVAGIEKLANSN
jgi:hypothetical protein